MKVLFGFLTFSIVVFLIVRPDWRHQLTKTARKFGLLSGLLPAALLAILAYFQFQQTNEIIKMSGEQLGYVKKPVFLIESRPHPHYRDSDFFNNNLWLNRLSLANVGNDSALNLRIDTKLLLLFGDKVCSYGKVPVGRAYFTDTTRTAREMIWPRRTLQTDSSIDVTPSAELFSSAYQFVPHGVDFRRDVYEIRDSLDARYLLVVVYAYRRPIDLQQFTDTCWLEFDLPWGPIDEAMSVVGGREVIDRARRYLEIGPPTYLQIETDRYAIWTQPTSHGRFLVWACSRRPGVVPSK